MKFAISEIEDSENERMWNTVENRGASLLVMRIVKAPGLCYSMFKPKVY